MADTIKEIEVVIGDGVAVLKRTGSSRRTMANILGTDTDDKGAIRRVYLDRLVHRDSERRKFVGWEASGAVSTILTRA